MLDPAHAEVFDLEEILDVADGVAGAPVAIPGVVERHQTDPWVGVGAAALIGKVGCLEGEDSGLEAVRNLATSGEI